MGVNIQAVVDHYGHFLYVAVAAPGGQPDVNVLLARTSLVDILAALPLGYFVVGGNTYPPSEGLVPVFGGNDRNIMANNDANFYMSQCQIRVEMAFGMMKNRFGILQSPLRVSPLHLGTLMQCMERLHNFMLTQNNDYNPYLTEEVRFSPPTRDKETGRETNGDKVEALAGVSLMREEIVRRVR
jgi:hypothetical protein